MSEDGGAAGGQGRRVRQDPRQRHRAFVQGAIDLFSEVGFDGGTRDLAQRLGVTQPLLYRYFPSKDDLIAAVYQEIYVDRWKPAWRAILADGSLPVAERLRRFYADYTATIFTPEWLRIYLFAGLRGVDINRRYVGTMEREILHPIAAAARAEFGLPARAEPLPEEVELFWTLHGGIFYWGVRKVVYGFAMAVDRETMIANAVDAFLHGASTVLRRVDESRPPLTA
jgi:AcrR family transcriptional regulator